MKRQAWLNIETGEFSNSWEEDSFDEELYENVEKQSKWKLIQYECLTDEDFEFYDKMVIK